MKKMKFYLIVVALLIVSYFSVDIYNGISGLFVAKHGEQAKSLTQTKQGRATTFVVNGSSTSQTSSSNTLVLGGTGDNSNGNDSGTNSSTTQQANFSQDTVKANVLPILNNIFTHAVATQNKTHETKDSGSVQKSFDSKIIDDGTYDGIVRGISIQTSTGSTMIIVNGKATSVNNKDGEYTFGNIVISDITQQGNFAQITGTFNYTVDKGKYSKQFSAFTDSSYAKITEIELQ
jgi:hypothetical protein